MKRIITLLLALVMLFSMTACNGNKKNGTTVIEGLDFEIGDTGGLEVPFGNGEEIEIFCTDEVGAENTYIFDKLGQILGLKITPMLAPVSTVSQKRTIVLASGDLPDIISANTLLQSNEFAMQGAFEPINPYMDKLPNVSRYFGKDGKYSWVAKSFAATDGQLYVFPQVDSSRLVNHGMLYRKDIFDKHGIEMWDSPETFYQALKKLKELYPDSYPLTSKTGKNIVTNYSLAWGGLRCYDTYYDEETKLWKYADTAPETKELLDYLHKLYKEGLLDPEFLTNTQPAWTTKMTNGKSFVTYDWIGRLDMFVEQSTIPGYDLRYGNPVGPRQTLITLDQVNVGGVSVSKSKNSELAMKVMDFLYSDAGAELMTCGIRGETFEIGEDGFAVYLDPELQAKEKVDIMDLRAKYCMWMAGSYVRTDHRSCYYKYSERETEAQEWVDKCAGLEPADPVVTFVGDSMSRITDLKTALTKKFEEVMFKYIVGQATGDEAWNKWLAEAKKLGEDELCKIYNDRHKELGL